MGEATSSALQPAPQQELVEQPETKQESVKPSSERGEKRSVEPASSTSMPPSKKSVPVDIFDMFAEEEEEKEEVKNEDVEEVRQAPKDEVNEEASGIGDTKAVVLQGEKSEDCGMSNAASGKSASFLLPRFARKSRPIVREPKEKSAPVEKGPPKAMTVEETQAEVWKVAEMLHQRHSTNTKSAGYLARCREKIERYKKAQVFVPGGTVLLDTSKFAAEVEQKRKNLKPGEEFDVPHPKEEKVLDDINEEDLESLRGVIMGFGKAAEKPKRVQTKLKLTVSNVFNQDSSSEEEGEGGMMGALSASGVTSKWTHKKPSTLPQ